jgi:uncharacterized protein
MLAASEPRLVDLLLLLAYPLHPPQKPNELRTVHFPSLHTPVLFVHGTRDSFGSIDQMAAARKLIPARTELLRVEGAGHELLTAGNRATLVEAIAARFAAFLEVHRPQPG